ncbi:MAG: hypothetical protein HY707_05615 [Ignavibacteriae bacterium]|nr:hypothetical protein [Ignavibacteriota bacterium]
MEKEFTTRLNFLGPFEQVEIEMELPEDAHVTLQVYDDTGREFATILHNKAYKAGVHRIEFDLSEYNPGTAAQFHGNQSERKSSGFYFYRLQAQGQLKSYVDTKRLMIDHESF